MADDATGSGDAFETSLVGLTPGTATDRGLVVPAETETDGKPDAGNGTPTGVADDVDGKTRERIAYRLIWILAAVIAAYLVVSLFFSQSCWSTATCKPQEAYNMAAGSFNTVFTALIGLVGSVVGFYFGSKSKA